MMIKTAISKAAISKAAVKHIPIIGTLAMAVQTIFVDRKDPQARSKAAAALKERGSAAGAAAGWPPVLIFPEGTCTNGQALISFKAGAFAIGAPVQPVVLRYPHEYCDPSAADTGYDRLLLLMLQVYNRLEVTYLPVVAPTAAEQEIIASADAMRDKLVQVDVHDVLGESEVAENRPALLQTQARLDAGAANFEVAAGYATSSASA